MISKTLFPKRFRFSTSTDGPTLKKATQTKMEAESGNKLRPTGLSDTIAEMIIQGELDKRVAKWLRQQPTNGNGIMDDKSANRLFCHCVPVIDVIASHGHTFFASSLCSKTPDLPFEVRCCLLYYIPRLELPVRRLHCYFRSSISSIFNYLFGESALFCALPLSMV